MVSLHARLEQADIILIDGGVGTEIERRGVLMDGDAWCGVATLEHPDVIRAVHEDYIRAGAEVITANTFGAARHVLEAAGREAEVASINRAAVQLAREARDEVAERRTWVAASMSSMPPLGARGLPVGANARASYREQAELLAEAGADLIIAEMMTHADNAALVVEAALQTGLPVWVGFSAEVDRTSGKLVPWIHSNRGVPPGALGETIDTVLRLGGVSAMGIMHSRIPDMVRALDFLGRRWSGPRLAYAESGVWKPPSWKFSGIVEPDEYAQAARQWVDAGVHIIGGCCGIGPEHIRALRETLPQIL